jgi:hypothetical protein
VLLLCDSFLLFGLRVVKAVLPSSYLWKSIFNSPTQFYLWSRLVDVLCSLWLLSFTFGLRVFFNSPTQFLPMKAGIEWCAALLWFLCVLVLRFFNLQFPPMKAGIEWCAALLWFLSLFWS